MERSRPTYVMEVEVIGCALNDRWEVYRTVQVEGSIISFSQFISS